MFLLVPAHPVCPGQNLESRKTVVCVCVCVHVHVCIITVPVTYYCYCVIAAC